jgi:hypothetical protein
MANGTLRANKEKMTRGQRIPASIVDGLGKAPAPPTVEPVAHDPALEAKQVGVAPAAAEPGVENNLTVHLVPVEVA